jgi:hypothetical protein
VAGWSEDKLNWMKWSEEKLLRPNDFTRVIKRDGTLSWAHISELDVEEYDQAAYKSDQLKPIPGKDLSAGKLKYQKSYNVRAEKVWAPYNDLPWIEKDREITLSDDADVSKSTKKTNETTDVDLSLYQSRGQAQEKSQSKLAWHRFAVPALQFRVRDENSLDLDIGSSVCLKEIPTRRAWIVDTDGNLTQQIDTDKNAWIDPQWCGTIVKRKWNVRDATYDVTVLLTNHLDNDIVRYRAPSAVIHEVSERDNIVYLEESAVNVSLTGSSYGDAQPDAFSFHSEDEVKIWKQDLSEIEWTSTVINASSSRTDTKTAPSGNDRYYIELESIDFDLGAGNVIRLSNMKEFSSENRGFDSNIERPFIYLSSDDGTLRKSSSEEEEADRYG